MLQHVCYLLLATAVRADGGVGVGHWRSRHMREGCSAAQPVQVFV
jgi:hypothetical protein